MADDTGEEFWSDPSFDYSTMVGPCREKDKPTSYKTDEQCEQEAQTMIYEHRISLGDDYGRKAGGLWTILMWLILPILLCIAVRVLDVIGLFDKIALGWNTIPK